MNELSLFTGAGGGLLGTKLLGFNPIGYVEWEPYCQAVLSQRIKDGFLEEAPIFGDIREFFKSGAAREYRGIADVVTAGFPCQPFSVAGRQAAAEDPRNMWPATADVLREVRPHYALLENVPGLLATGYCERIFADLAEMGFDARWGVFSAGECGAPHERERLFILAHAQHYGVEVRRRIEFIGQGGKVARGVHGFDRQSLQFEKKSLSADFIKAGLEGFKCANGGESKLASIGALSWWEAEPDVGRVVHGLACRVDRIKSLGNGQVPIVAARAWQELSR